MTCNFRSKKVESSLIREMGKSEGGSGGLGGSGGGTEGRGDRGND